VYRLLGWNPHLPIFFRLVERLRCWTWARWSRSPDAPIPAGFEGGRAGRRGTHGIDPTGLVPTAPIGAGRRATVPRPQPPNGLAAEETSLV